jgi:hypothetical protein
VQIFGRLGITGQDWLLNHTTELYGCCCKSDRVVAVQENAWEKRILTTDVYDVRYLGVTVATAVIREYERWRSKVWKCAAR